MLLLLLALATAACSEEPERRASPNGDDASDVVDASDTTDTADAAGTTDTADATDAPGDDASVDASTDAADATDATDGSDADPTPQAGNTRLSFSDLISGPDTGLGDGQGSGVIVTIWGQGLGSAQGSGKVYFTDSTGTKQQAAHVYYWKDADGTLPSGPANLHASHRMQEIAFSIPDAESGPGEITVEVDGAETNALPFTVRPGSIYHVKSSGDDANPGSWSEPWASVAKADATAPAGSTIYVHDVDTGDASSVRGVYWNNGSASSTLDAQFAITAYPGFHPSVSAQKGVEAYNADALVVSKLDIYASNYTSVDANGQPTGSTIHFGGTFGIRSSKHGRAVANRIGDLPGGCASKAQGAIVGNAQFSDIVSNFKILGNEIYEYGCNGSDKLHHTTYMSIRSAPDDLQVDPWEFGYNYLHGNKAKFGIHQFDQDDGCGDTTGPIRIYDNVIVDQGGAGISVGSQCDWSMDVIIENNVLINTGLAADWDGLDPDTAVGRENGGIAIRDSGLLGTMYVRNNTIFGWSNDGTTMGGRGCLTFNGSEDNVTVFWERNVCHTDIDVPFVGAGFQADAKLDNVSGINNVWYYSGDAPTEAVVPSWDSVAITADPQLQLSGHVISLGESSSARDASATTNVTHDVYGVVRDQMPDLGAVEAAQ